MICHFRHVPRVGDTSVWKIRFLAVRQNKEDWTKGLNKKNFVCTKLGFCSNDFLFGRIATPSQSSFYHLRLGLFVVVFCSTREFYTNMETSPVPVKGCKFWPMLGIYGHCEGSLACNTYCDKGHPFIIVISKSRDTHTYCLAFGSGAVNTCCHCRVWDSKAQPSACGANALTDLDTTAVCETQRGLGLNIVIQ